METFRKRARLLTLILLILMLIYTVVVLARDRDRTIQEKYNNMTVIDKHKFGSDLDYATIYVVHDDKRGVTCWIYQRSNDDMSCLSDKDIMRDVKRG